MTLRSSSKIAMFSTERAVISLPLAAVRRESRTGPPPGGDPLDISVFHRLERLFTKSLQDQTHIPTGVSLWTLFGEARVDLFASKENAKCPLWFSRIPTDCAPLGVNALGLEPWPRALLYAFPPYRLLPSLLDRFEVEGRRLILVAPFETSNSWFARMVRWIKGARFDLPLQEDAISQA